VLLKHYSSDYVIKLKDGAIVLYSLLYNLSSKELEILREYIVTLKRLE
jgi:hypothetical protein